MDKIENKYVCEMKIILCNYRISHEDSYNANLTAIIQDFT